MRRQGRDRLVAAAAVVVVVAIIVTCNVGGLLRPTTASGTLTERPPAPGASAQTADCERSVIGMIGLVPDARGYGLKSGVSDRALRTRYGAGSREVVTFVRVQREILTFFRLHGLVRISDVLRAERPAVRLGCAGLR